MYSQKNEYTWLNCINWNPEQFHSESQDGEVSQSNDSGQE